MLNKIANATAFLGMTAYALFVVHLMVTVVPAEFQRTTGWESLVWVLYGPMYIAGFTMAVGILLIPAGLLARQLLLYIIR